MTTATTPGRARRAKNRRAARHRIADFCKRHAVRKLALFGSVLHDDFRPDSDVDVLVEFEPGHVPGLAFFRMQDELSEILNATLSYHTPAFLSPYFPARSRKGRGCPVSQG